MANETEVQKKEKLNTEQSLEKRLERIKAKQRDRGGIFKPREDNPFLELLMSRDVSGRSPTKRRSTSRQSSVDSQSRGGGSKPKKAAALRATERRKSIATSAAGNQRRKSVAPSVAAGRSATGKMARDKPRRMSFFAAVRKPVPSHPFPCLPSFEHFSRLI